MRMSRAKRPIPGCPAGYVTGANDEIGTVVDGMEQFEERERIVGKVAVHGDDG